MVRIKLPGKERTKKLILLILIIISILVLYYERSINIKNNTSQNNKTIQDEEKNIKSKDTQEQLVSEQDESSLEENISAKENDLYNEAYKLFFSKEYEKSIIKADELINEFPNSYIGYNIRGIAKAYNGNFDGAMKDINKSLQINEDYGYAKFNKALTYELYGNMDEALKWYNKDLEGEEYVWSYYGIASIYGRKGDVSNTMIYLNKAIQMDEAVKDIAKTEHDFNLVIDSKEFQEAVNN